MQTSPLERMLRFTGVNIVLVPLNLLAGYLLTDISHVHYILGSLAGYGAQVIVGFFIQRTHVFHREDIRAARGLCVASIVECGSVMIMLGTMLCFVEWFALGFVMSRILSMFCVGVWDYIAHSVFTFRTNPFT